VQREHDDADLRIEAMQASRQLQSIDTRQIDVAQDDIR